MTACETLFDNALLTDGRRVAFAVSAGRIAGVLDEGARRPQAGTIVDLGGALTIPGFVEGHIHLDTSFWGDAWRPHLPCANGFDVHERVAFQRRNMAEAAPMIERARSQLALCVAKGSTRMRSHLIVDDVVGLSHAEQLLELREQTRHLIDLQLVAFPQSGILAAEGVADLLDQAVAMGCDVIGGLDPASFDRDVEGHLNVVFDIAERRGVPVDIHLHDHGTLGVFEIERICEKTAALGMQGLVGVSHAYGLGDVGAEAQAKIAATLAEAGVAIMTTAPGSHPFPPVATLRAAGVTVWAGNDNIRDSWAPFGDGDMLRRAEIIAYRSGFKTDAELDAAFEMVTAQGAAALGLADYGFQVDAPADFVALTAPHAACAVVDVPQNRQVWKSGQLVARDGALLQPL